MPEKDKSRLKVETTKFNPALLGEAVDRMDPPPYFSRITRVKCDKSQRKFGIFNSIYITQTQHLRQRHVRSLRYDRVSCHFSSKSADYVI